jgi:peptidyl-prolyl cis-trans isomerase D
MLKYFRNRKTMGYLVGSALLVLVIFAFIILYIPDFMRPAGGANLSDEIANVAGVSISGRLFLQRYRAQERMYRSQLGDQLTPAMMRQLGLDEMVLQGLVQDALLVVEAERQGIKVTDEELRNQILEDPTLQANGQFIGRDAYLRLLKGSGLTPQQYEEQLRRALLRDKLRTMVTDAVVVSSQEVAQEYRRRNEKADLEYLFVPRDKFEETVEVTDEDVAEYYEANSEEYRLPTQRQVRYFTLTPQSFQASVQVTEREIERYYNQNIYLYETPEQVAASHILFKTADKDEEEVRRRAEDVLKQIRAGADFAEMARKYSEDTSAEQGGSLGLFSRGDMVPEFEQAAFSLSVGEVSNLIRTPYGYHIIKVTEHRAPVVRPLDSVRDEIRNVLVQEKTNALLEEAVVSAREFLQHMASLDALAQRYGSVELKETPFFGRTDPLPQLGNSSEAKQLAFELEIGEVSPPVRVGAGYAFFEVTGENPPRVPDLEEIKDQVRTDLIQKKAMELARIEAEEILSQLKAGKDAEKIAKDAGLELKSSEGFLRSGQLPDVGRAASVREAAFSDEPNGFSDLLPTANGYVLLRVLQRTGYSDEQFASEKDDFTDQILNEKKQRAWSAYLQELTRRYTVRIDRQMMHQLTG